MLIVFGDHVLATRSLTREDFEVIAITQGALKPGDGGRLHE